MFKMVKKSMAMAWPLVGSRLLVALTNFFSMWLVASQGSLYLAAAALIFVMQTAITVVMSSVLFAISPIVGRAFGSQDYQKVGSVTQQGWFISIWLTLPTIVVLWFSKDILIQFGQVPALAQIVGDYFHVTVWGIIPMFFFSTNQMVMAGVGQQRLAFAASLVAAATLVVVAYPLTHGHFGLPALGIIGVAVGMSASMWAGFLFSLIYSFRLKNFEKFEFFRWRLKSSWGYLKQILMIGWPISMQVGSELFAWFTVTLLIGWLGDQALEARQIVSQFNILVIIPVMGLAQASSILIGQASGAKQYHLVKRLGFTHITMGAVLMFVVLIIYCSIPQTLIRVFLNPLDSQNALVAHWAVILFVLSGIMLIFDTMRNIVMGSLRGLYDSRYPMMISVIMIWLIGLPLGYHLAFSEGLGVVGFAISDMVGALCAALILVWRWHMRVNILMAKADLSDATAK